jgi:hypothetical protein
MSEMRAAAPGVSHVNQVHFVWESRLAAVSKDKNNCLVI